jgi:hypothetical protein
LQYIIIASDAVWRRSARAGVIAPVRRIPAIKMRPWGTAARGRTTAGDLRLLGKALRMVNAGEVRAELIALLPGQRGAPKQKMGRIPCEKMRPMRDGCP